MSVDVKPKQKSSSTKPSSEERLAALEARLEASEKRNAELEAKLASKPSGRGKAHPSEYVVSADYVRKQNSVWLYQVAGFMVARDEKGNAIKRLSQKGFRVNVMADGVDRQNYMTLNSIASQAARYGMEKLSDKQINVICGIITEMAALDLIEIK